MSGIKGKSGIYIRSELNKKHLSDSHRGQKLSEETKKKMSISRKGRISPTKGMTWKWKYLKPKNRCSKCGKELKDNRNKTCRKCIDYSNYKGKIPWNKGIKRPDFTGENHPRFIKDRSLLIKNIEKHERNNKEYYYWRYLVFKRDSKCCKINNCDCEGKIIAHHILPWRDYPELRYNINNGITLCQFHHPRKRVDEKRLIPFFQSMVEVKE
jgi:hypothetical protein